VSRKAPLAGNYTEIRVERVHADVVVLRYQRWNTIFRHPPVRTDVSSEASRPTMQGEYNSPETPLGIWLVSILGFFGALVGLVTGIGLLAVSDVHVAVSVALVVLALAQAITMLALVGLTPWAWYATVVLYTVQAGVSVVYDEFGGLVISLVVVAYVATRRELFRT
jgi:hypothetical protein